MWSRSTRRTLPTPGIQLRAAALVLLTGETLSAKLLASTSSGHRPPAAPSQAAGSPVTGAVEGAGGSYALYGGGQTSKSAIITGNVFSRMYWPGSGYYGTNAYWHRDPSNKWVNNRWADGPKVGRPIRPKSG